MGKQAGRMQKGQNYNAPIKGAKTTVEPLTKKKDIALIKKQLEGKPLDYALFVVGINTNLRASDLLRIKYDDVKGLPIDGEITLKEKKTGKHRRVTMNANCIDAIQRLIDAKDFEAGDDLFKGQRGTIGVPALNLKVKRWCREINLTKGNYGSHTLRKTWAFHQYKTFKTPLPVIMECLNHSSQKQTLAYICIQPEEIKSVYLNAL